MWVQDMLLLKSLLETAEFGLTYGLGREERHLSVKFFQLRRFWCYLLYSMGRSGIHWQESDRVFCIVLSPALVFDNHLFYLYHMSLSMVIAYPSKSWFPYQARELLDTWGLPIIYEQPVFYQLKTCSDAPCELKVVSSWFLQQRETQNIPEKAVGDPMHHWIPALTPPDAIALVSPRQPATAWHTGTPKMPKKCQSETPDWLWLWRSLGEPPPDAARHAWLGGSTGLAGRLWARWGTLCAVCQSPTADVGFNLDVGSGWFMIQSPSTARTNYTHQTAGTTTARTRWRTRRRTMIKQHAENEDNPNNPSNNIAGSWYIDS